MAFAMHCLFYFKHHASVLIQGHNYVRTKHKDVYEQKS
jgi:hypothetical protein